MYSIIHTDSNQTAYIITLDIEDNNAMIILASQAFR